MRILRSVQITTAIASGTCFAIAGLRHYNLHRRAAWAGTKAAAQVNERLFHELLPEVMRVTRGR